MWLEGHSLTLERFAAGARYNVTVELADPGAKQLSANMGSQKIPHLLLDKNICLC